MSVKGDVTANLGPAADSAPVWRPEIVSWNTTQHCNLRCGHCYLAAGERAPVELSFDEGCRLIDELAAAGTRMLILTGGEPLMRRDIIKLATHAFSRGLLAVAGTNGMLLSPRLVRELKEAGVAGAGISLDSLDPAKHDVFRGVPGAWERAVRGIRLCVAQELPVLLQMTVLPWNYAEVEEVMEFAHREGATAFNLYFLVCTGRGERLSDITSQQYEQALGSLVEAQRRYPQMMVRARCAPQISRVASLAGSALIGNAGCLTARQYCRITSEGDVTPCPYLPLVGGNVRQQSFADIWQRSHLFQQLREGPLTGRCGGCGFRPVCGGCRARAFALTGDILAEDPWCAYQPSDDGTPRSGAALTWTPEAEQRLQRIPPFIRQRVKAAVERCAVANHTREIAPEVLTATLESLGRRIPFRRPRSIASADPLAQQGDGHGDTG